MISSLQSTNSLFTYLSTSSSSLTSAGYSSSLNSFDSALTNLMSAIKSGDSTAARKYLAQVEKLSSSNLSSNSPLGEFLSSVSTALSNNNMAGAKSALTTLETYAIPSGSNSAASVSSDGSDSSTSGTSAMAQDVVNLFSAINSGNSTDAQSAYDALTSLLNTNASSSSSSTSSASSGTDSFQKLLAQIGSALGSGNVKAAQSALDSFLQNLSSGSLVSTTA